MSDFPPYSAYQTFCHKALYKLNALFGKAFPRPDSFVRPPFTAQESSDKIAGLLQKGEPCMIARFGSVELYCLANYMSIKSKRRDYWGFIRGKVEPWWWALERISTLNVNAGFFPVEENAVVRFCEIMADSASELDLLGSWLTKEKCVSHLLSSKEKVFLPYLEPWFASKPWTGVLEGKRIVVVHPFAEQIEVQYRENRKQLFANESILPQFFSLRVVKSVMSMGVNASTSGFDTWFDALDWMKKQIDKEDYDVCLIGCGSYGFPLAAHVKRSGKQAVHLGGALQLLFGIKGNRWEDERYGVKEWGLPEGFYPKMFNEYWTKPLPQYYPIDAMKVERACYW